MRKFVFGAFVAGLLVQPVIADDDLGGVETDANVVESVEVIAVDGEETLEFHTLEVQVEGEVNSEVEMDGEIEVIEGIEVDGHECDHADGVCPEDSPIVTFDGDGLIRTTVVDENGLPPAHFRNLTGAGAEVMHTTSIANPAALNAVSAGAANLQGINQLSVEQRNTVRLFEGRGEKPRSGGSLFRLFGRTEAGVQTVSGRELTAAEKSTARQMAEIDRLRDQAIVAGDAKLLATADAMEARVRARSTAKASFFSRFSRSK